MESLTEAYIGAPDQPAGTTRRLRLIGLALIASAAVLSFYLLLLAVVIASIGGVVAMISLGGAGMALAVPVGLLLAAARRTVVAAIPHRPRLDLPGVDVPRSFQRALWDVVDKVSHRVARGRVDELRLVMGGAAHAVEVGGGVPLRARRALTLPLTYFEALSQLELEVVIAHELGHVAAGDTTLFRWLSWLNAVVGRTLVKLHELQSVLRHPFGWHMRLLGRAMAAYSRRRELAADRVSAELFGASTVAGTLRRTWTLEPAFDWYWSELRLALDAGLRPPIVEGFRTFLTSPTVSEPLASIPDESGTFASHPSLELRLGALGVGSDGEDEASAPGSLSLLADVDTLERVLLEDIASDDTTPLLPVTWEEASRRALPPVWHRFVNASELAQSAVRVSELPRLLAPADADAPGDAEHRTALATCALTLALLDDGWTLHRLPGYPSRLGEEDREIVPREVVRALAVGEMTTAQWAEHCCELDIGDLVMFGQPRRVGEEPSAESTARTESDAEIRARIREPAITGGKARLAVALTVAFGAPLGVAALVAPLSSDSPTAGHVVVRVIGVTILCAVGWLLWRRRMARIDPPSLAIDAEGLTLTHRQLLRAAFQLPHELIRVVAVDSGSESGSPHARFPLFDNSTFSSHALRSKAPRGWIWPSGRGRIPFFGLTRDVPNVLVLLNDDVPGARVRREKLHGPLNGERLSALAIRVEEPEALTPVLQAHGLQRDLTLADVARL